MKPSVKLIILILDLIILGVSLIWAYSSKWEWEPIVVSLGALVTLIYFFFSGNNPDRSQEEKGNNKSIVNSQIGNVGGDITLGDSK